MISKNMRQLKINSYILFYYKNNIKELRQLKIKIYKNILTRKRYKIIVLIFYKNNNIKKLY